MSDVKDLIFEDLNPTLNLTRVTDKTGLEQIADFFQRKDVFGFDTETNVVKSLYNRKIRTIQVGDREEQYVIDLLPFAGSPAELLDQGGKIAPGWAKNICDILKVGLDSKKHLKVGVRLQFDYEVMFWCLGVRSHNFYDCFLAEQVIQCGRVPLWEDNFWGMENMVQRYCKLHMQKALQKSFDLETPLTPEQYQYAALDTRLPLAIKKSQEVTIAAAGLSTTVMVENAAVPAYGDMRINGFYLNPQSWMNQVAQVRKQHASNIETLDKYFIPVVGSKERPVFDLQSLEAAWRDEKDKEKRAQFRVAYQSASKTVNEWDKKSLKWEGQAAINYGANPQMLAALQKMGLDITDTNDKTLDKYATKKAVAAVRDYRSSNKALDTYGVSFLEHIDVDTGRIHSNISQIGADTGRSASSSPNLQNIPKDDSYRHCFQAREGYKLVVRDFAGCELRIIAEESGEESWIEALKRDEDLHSVCGALLYGDEWLKAAEEGCAYYKDDKHLKCSCKEHKKLRNYLKAVNFGIAYGMGEVALASKLYITVEEAKKLLETYFAKFKKVTAYLKMLGERAKQKLESRTKIGRRRIFDKPVWENARKKAEEYALADGRTVQSVTSKEIGRIFYGWFGSVEREGKNAPIQGGNADLTKYAMALMWERLEPEYGALIVLMVHDEVIVECPAQHAEAVDKLMDECMTLAGKLISTKVVMMSGGCISDVWEKGE